MKSDKDKKKKGGVAETCGTVCGIAGALIYQFLALPILVPSRASNFSLTEAAGAGLVGGVCAAVGYGICKLIERIRK